mmetsp:Transcript_24986/g.55405  ORF Transcript_24986/g.55405 Transcript_24986/m.55405 type:complete len:112 (+) Transcript_24986:107-442(+)
MTTICGALPFMMYVVLLLKMQTAAQCVCVAKTKPISQRANSAATSQPVLQWRPFKYVHFLLFLLLSLVSLLRILVLTSRLMGRVPISVEMQSISLGRSLAGTAERRGVVNG